ncbi:MAG TPA: biotin/lipoyl-binding protein [Pirellulaceae bacterium]|nr:biotin/lipoyl-binding protein [Pirellulaceae bacterium]HMO93350.1 biotin/lipoyl-binding protein [Pirellulaceae bacterium]HMP70121.1 biotin/lipoyl-binding protein [Pirellulaceae bacterium]
MANELPVASGDDENADRTIAYRRRLDLQISASEFQGEKCWIIKDPVSLKYFRIREPEFVVFNMLNGRTTLNQIQASLSRLFGGASVELAHVRALIGSLFQRGLLVSQRLGQATRLLDRRHKVRRARLISQVTNLLSIRFPGIDPEKFLSWLYPKVSWFFHPICVLLCFVIVALAGLLVLVNANEVYHRLPQMQQFFGIDNLLLMGCVFMITKSLHEIGHGLACKHFGGECHEIGFMLLVLMPVMYCNTSDSWILRNKWHRMAIGAAGMYVEVLIASLCTFIWWYANPGIISTICLNIIFLSSLTTVVFNANPLMRFDGYYILSDFLEIPNLTQKSRAALLNKLRVWCLGLPPLPARMLPSRNQVAFASYSIASFVYRWVILFSILWFISKVFEPYGLQVIGQYMIAASLFGLIVVPIFKLTKFFSMPGIRSHIHRGRMLLTFFVVALLLFLVMWIPVPQYVYAPLTMRPQNAKAVYVKQPGVLVECYVEVGQAVKAGDPIARLQDLDTEAKLIQVEGHARQLETEVELLSRLETIAPQQVQHLSATLSSLQAASNRLLGERRIFESLLLRAPTDGIVIPPSLVRMPNNDSQQLDRWHGSPLERENLFAYLERDTEFCRIDTTGIFEAVLDIDQTDLDLVRPGCTVSLMLREYPHRRLSGSIREIAISDATSRNPGPNQQPVNQGSQFDAYGRPLVYVTNYQATVPLDDNQVQLIAGFSGEGKIYVGSAPLGRQLLRYLRTVFNFRW